MYGITFYSYSFQTLADNLVEIKCHNRFCHSEEQYFNGYVNGEHGNVHCTKIKAYFIGATGEDYDARVRAICAAHTIKLRNIHKCHRQV